mmetsp:Transcript_34428/g.61853  ORF Transcript_34428/g.61853 Transcript_34428/m.61853 type:complete len:359 (+) Transcript_34428:95-1171(+)
MGKGKKKQGRAAKGANNSDAKKVRCTDCRNARAGVKCDGCEMNLCHRCANQSDYTWYQCPNRKKCVNESQFLCCEPCGDIQSKRRNLDGWRSSEERDDQAILSDQAHQKDSALVYCGGYDKGSCMALGSVREPMRECKFCAASGDGKLRTCELCGKIRCLHCLGCAQDFAKKALADSKDSPQWKLDLYKCDFVENCIKRCGECGRDVCVECVSKDTLTSNARRGRLFDESDLCSRFKHIMSGAEEVQTGSNFKCDECRLAKNKCHNPECSKNFVFTCIQCDKGKYCSKECQTVMWPSHKPECIKRKEKYGEKKKAAMDKSNGGEQKATAEDAKTKAAKMKTSEANEMIGDIWKANDRH